MTDLFESTVSLRCPRCGSRDCQTREVAFSHSHRRTEGGHQSISAFGESVAPPQKRSVFWSPIGIGIGVGCTTLFVASALLGQDVSLDAVLARVSDSRALWTGLVTGALTFVAIALRAAAWNETSWRGLHAAWRRGSVCRRCGHQFGLSHTSLRRESTRG